MTLACRASPGPFYMQFNRSTNPMRSFFFTALSRGVLFALTACLVVAAPPEAAGQELTDNPEDLVEDLPRDRRAQTGMSFLSVSMDARAAALGDAVTAREGGSYSMFYNPAGMAQMEGGAEASFGHMQWIADMRYNYASAAFQPFGGRYGVVGLSFRSVNYGDMEGTIRFNNEDGYRDVGSFSPSAWSVGLGYARAITDQFSVGGNVRYASQSLGTGVMGINEGGDLRQREFSEGTLAYDFGILFDTGFRGMNFAVSVRNFSQEITYVEENVELPLTFRVGTAIDVNEFAGLSTEMHDFELSVDAERPRDYDEQMRMGLEYLFMETLALRAGYGYPTDERGINLGAGIQSTLAGAEVGFDYNYTEFGLFGNVNRFALRLGF